MINKDKIFQLFVDGKEITDDKTKKDIKDFMNGPLAKIGMFIKLIQNHHVFHKKLEQPNYNVESTKDASEFTIYNRAWNYISKIDVDKEDHLNAIINFDPKLFLSCLNGSIRFFEEYEEYEKCAHLFKIQKLVKEI